MKKAALELLIEFRARYPGRYTLRQLYTLQRRVRVWRREAIDRLITKESGFTPAVFSSSVPVTSSVRHPVTKLREATRHAPLVVREGGLVVETIERVRIGLPFGLRALDVDNGSEFVNDKLIGYCLSQGIELTRSRPYRKNDQAWVEQKNGAIVRKLLGYRRFEGLAAARAIFRLYGASRLFVNFFQPSFKLGAKHRDGAKVSKRYHPPQTPCA